MNKYPKKLPLLTKEEVEISNDWMKYWLSIYKDKYSSYAKFNHDYIVSRACNQLLSPVLEIGCGDGEHLSYEAHSGANLNEYFALDIRQNLLDVLSEKFPQVNAINADCQNHLPFETGYFKRVVAIHVLEHLPDLPRALDEIHRVLSLHDGIFQVVLPCEGGLLYTLARKVTSERIFNRRYNAMKYSKLIRSEHLSTFTEVMDLLLEKFYILERSHYPLRVPIASLNLAVGLTLKARRT